MAAADLPFCRVSSNPLPLWRKIYCRCCIIFFLIQCPGRLSTLPNIFHAVLVWNPCDSLSHQWGQLALALMLGLLLQGLQLPLLFPSTGTTGPRASGNWTCLPWTGQRFLQIPSVCSNWHIWARVFEEYVSGPVLKEHSPGPAFSSGLWTLETNLQNCASVCRLSIFE